MFAFRFRFVRALARVLRRAPVQCHTCPHWIYHGPQFYKPAPAPAIPNVFRYNPRGTLFMGDEPELPLINPTDLSQSQPNPLAQKTFLHHVGVCARDTPALSNVGKLGFSFKAWTATDWCPRHPLYKAAVAGPESDLRADHSDQGLAGFSRAPTINEAFRLAQVAGDPAPFLAPRRCGYCRVADIPRTLHEDQWPCWVAGEPVHERCYAPAVNALKYRRNDVE